MTTKKPAEEKKNLPATTTGAQLPAHLSGDVFVADQGLGLSTASEDNNVPLIYLLQTNSPQVDERDQDYVDGAKPGDIWLRNSPDPIAKGAEGIAFQPCYFYRDVIEWAPNRGGFVDRHADFPAGDVEEYVDDQARKKFRRTSTGNDLVETRYFVGLVYGRGSSTPYVIPLSGTGHTFARNWMFLMNQQQVDGKRAPSFSRKYRLTTIIREKNNNKWFMYKVDDLGWVETAEDYARGKALYTAFDTGTKRIDQPVDEGATVDGPVPF